MAPTALLGVVDVAGTEVAGTAPVPAPVAAVEEVFPVAEVGATPTAGATVPLVLVVLVAGLGEDELLLCLPPRATLSASRMAMMKKPIMSCRLETWVPGRFSLRLVAGFEFTSSK